jgi:hypothetical protein
VKGSEVKWSEKSHKSVKNVVKRSKVKGSEVKCSVVKGWKWGVMGRVYMGGKLVWSEGLGKSVCAIWWEKY